MNDPKLLQMTIEARYVYGEVKFYPLCNAAHLFTAISRTKTMSMTMLQHIKALGYAITVRQEEIKV
jgi:hypothetical protein